MTARDDGVPPALAHYLLVGCYSGGPRPDLDVHLLAGFVMRGDLTGLRGAWGDVGAVVKRGHRGETFAERVLKRGAWREGDARCDRRCRANSHTAKETPNGR